MAEGGAASEIEQADNDEEVLALCIF